MSVPESESAALLASEEAGWTDWFTTQCHVCGERVEYLRGERVNGTCEHQMGEVYDDPVTLHNVERLLRMPDGDFRDLVSYDVRGTRVEALRHDDVLDRWGEALTAINLHIDAQLSAAAGERDLETRRWRGAARTVQSGIHARKAEHKRLNYERHERRTAEAQRRKAERIATGTQPRLPRPGKPGTKEERALAGEIAVKRLIATHRADFDAFLAQALAAMGVEDEQPKASEVPSAGDPS